MKIAAILALLALSGAALADEASDNAARQPHPLRVMPADPAHVAMKKAMWLHVKRLCDKRTKMGVDIRCEFDEQTGDVHLKGP